MARGGGRLLATPAFCVPDKLSPQVSADLPTPEDKEEAVGIAEAADREQRGVGSKVGA
jgi:hypothetical protein